MSRETLDLIAELEALRDISREGLRRLKAGEAKNGYSSLRRVYVRADDAVRHATKHEVVSDA